MPSSSTTQRPHEPASRRTTRRHPPPPATTVLDDDFDAPTLPATSARVSMWMPDEAPLLGMECAFGGATERVVRSSGALLLESARSEHTATHASMDALTLSILRSRRTSRAAGPDPERPDEWTSLGRRARDGRAGTRRLVPKTVLEDTPERTVTLWRAEIVPAGAAYASDESTLAGSAGAPDEFGRYKSSSHRKKSAGSTSSKIKSKLGSGPARSESLRPALTLSALGLADTTNYPEFSRAPSISPIHPPSSSPTYASPQPIPLTKPLSPLGNALPIPNLPPLLATPRMPLRPRRQSNASVPATTTRTLEGLLSECRPPLLHLRPILRDIGITQREHLRAVGRMSEATRNSEIKRAVLALGVSVVEWAMLIDLACSRA